MRQAYHSADTVHQRQREDTVNRGRETPFIEGGSRRVSFSNGGVVLQQREPFVEGGRTPFVKVGTQFVNDGGRTL